MKKTALLLEKIAYLGGYYSGWLVPLMMMLVVVEVFMRYVLRQPLMVADEFSAYMLVALAYLGMAYTWRQGGHVRVTVLISRLPYRVSSWIRFAGLILVFIFMVELDRVGYKMVVYALQINLRSSTWLMVPLFCPQLTVFVGFVLLTLLIAVDIVQMFIKIRAGERVEV
jgi:TRAP-type C4-dicarboxylate transport system permease small subunit